MKNVKNASPLEISGETDSKGGKCIEIKLIRVGIVHKLVSWEVVGGEFAFVRGARWVGSSEGLGDGMRVPICRHVRNGNMTSQEWVADGIRVKSKSMLDVFVAERAHDGWLIRRSSCETPETAVVQLI